jgi:hypothetical protein
MNKDIVKLTEAYLNVRSEKTPVNEVVFPETNDVPHVKRHATTGYSGEQEETNLTSINKKIMTVAMENAYGTKQPLLIFGAPGTSKSASILQFAKKMASISQSSSGGNREFKYWNKCSEEEHNQILQSPGEYFVLFDVRTVRYDPTDITGVPVPIPDTIDKNVLRTVKYSWIVALCKPEIDGVLFFDEINQGSQSMMNLLMSITLDRDFDGVPMSKNIGIIAAGNLEGGYNTQLPPALMNRFSAGVLTLDPEDWLDWAKGTDEEKEKEGSRVDSWITSFVESDLARYRYVQPVTEGNKPFPSWRAFQKLSDKMRYIERKHEAYRAKRIVPEVNMFDEVAYEAGMLCGVDWAQDFMIFIGYTSKFSVEQIIKDPAQFIEDHLKEPKKASTPGAVNPNDARVLKRGRVYAFITWLANKTVESFKDITSDPTFKIIVKDIDGKIREDHTDTVYKKGDLTMGVKSTELDGKTPTKNTASLLAFGKAITEVLKNNDDKVVLKDCVMNMVGGERKFGQLTSALAQVCRNTGLVDLDEVRKQLKAVKDGLTRIEDPGSSTTASTGDVQTSSAPKGVKTFATTPKEAPKPTTAQVTSTAPKTTQATSTAPKPTNNPMGQYGLF